MRILKLEKLPHRINLMPGDKFVLWADGKRVHETAIDAIKSVTHYASINDAVSDIIASEHALLLISSCKSCNL